MLIPTLLLISTMCAAQTPCPMYPKDTMRCWYDSGGVRVSGYAVVRFNPCGLPSDSVYHENTISALGYVVLGLYADRKARIRLPAAVAYASKD